MRHCQKMLAIVLLLLPFAIHAADLSGLWQTTDDKTGKPRSLVRIVENAGEYSAIVEKGLLATDTGDAVCDKCTDERKGQKIVGMTIAKHLKKSNAGTVYENGEILDPENGKTYKCKMTLSGNGNELEVRGFIGFSLLGRSQLWKRVE
ncbi:DUF2147 domain-containing protein [Methylophilus medardicus]|uniref:DUF2147 domain-containing protein n=1 Tax=Methylophilus medardicus TaxID=2588534 RepID=A0A5B8CQT5_9PROT|nr:DUF2147 domain-containing protein [Methylophilus medardicus]QDC43621.1 DUF2147 domain-containing protein [Methylophilus medardicus]QDC48628.1 DUF2147 domain-containing protein [Methylophilus medardicus]QDC52333.1 DUF2147 domain-containing protein [Methylophilus medardicus]